MKRSNLLTILHWAFVERHGWFVNGLDPAGGAWNHSSSTVIFKQHANNAIHVLFEEKLTSGGFGFHHTAVLAATFESLVHADCVERLCTAYRMLDLSIDAQIGETEANGILKVYLVIYVQGTNYASAQASSTFTPLNSIGACTHCVCA